MKITIECDCQASKSDSWSVGPILGGFIIRADEHESISFPILQTITGELSIAECLNLVSLSFPSLVATNEDVGIQSNPNLADFSAPNWLPTVGTDAHFENNALTAASMNHILSRYVAANVSSTIIHLEGGTNAAPTGQGLVDKDILISNGCSVTTN